MDELFVYSTFGWLWYTAILEKTGKIEMLKAIITSNFKQTQQLGFDFAKNLKGGEVLALYGDLGSGKTTFIQGLAVGLGIKRPIISPTFIIMRTYKIGTRPPKTSLAFSGD